MKIEKKKELEKKYNFKGNYIKNFENFRDEIVQKKIIPYQVEFQAPPRGKKICWLECPYCYGLSADNNGDRLSKERGLEILKQILDGGVKKNNICWICYRSSQLFLYRRTIRSNYF